MKAMRALPEQRTAARVSRDCQPHESSIGLIGSSGHYMDTPTL